VIVANHNSHLDTVVLMSLYPLSMIHKLRPVAAADYFVEQGGFIGWLSQKCIGIIPMDRSGKTERVILFPEGSRGEPERMSDLKKGVHFLLKDRPDTSVTPVMLHGLGRALPKGEALLVPFNCDVIIGDQIDHQVDADEFILPHN